MTEETTTQTEKKDEKEPIWHKIFSARWMLVLSFAFTLTFCTCTEITLPSEWWAAFGFITAFYFTRTDRTSTN